MSIGKKLLSICFILLMVIVIPQTFAGDVDNSTELASEIPLEDQISEVEVENNEVTLNDDDILSDESDDIYVSPDGDDKNSGNESSPFKTINRALNEALEGKTNIYITEGTYHENGLEVLSSVNIRGIGNVVIDADGNDRIFKIDGLYVVEISGLTLTNGVAPEDQWTADIHEVVYYSAGGAINIVEATVLIENCTFISNYAADFGGAINSESDRTTIKKSKFFSNEAGVFGGAIDFEADKGSVDNCTFVYNTAGNGGAIGYIANAGTIINSLFENNTAENGAAIFIENGGITSNGTNDHLIRNNKFIHNEAIQQGGAIEIENQQMSENADWTLIEGNEFIDNYAYNGGAISAYYGDSGIKNNLFENNSASYGGAIAAISTTDSSYIIIGGIYLENNRIVNCIAEENGNAIYNVGYFGTTANITFVEGKTVSCLDGKAVILNVTVCDDMGNPISGSPIDFTVNGKTTINPATDLIEGNGSVRFVPRENGTFTISGIFTHKFNINKINLVTGQIIVDNAIADYFGTIYISQDDGDDDNTGAKDSPVKTFNQGYVLATREGGSFDIVVMKGTYNVPSCTLSSSLNITGIGNPVLDGKNQGTLFSLYGGPDDEFHFTGLTFKNGVADPSKYAGMNEGGAIFHKGGKLYLENDVFLYNSASDYGGAVHINKGMDSWGTFYRAFAYITNCTFKNNLAKYYGGAISLYDCDVFVDKCNFESNTAKHGGAICVLNSFGNLTVTDSVFTKNSASEFGGAIEAECLNTYNVRYWVKVFNSTFIENNADDYGGAIAGGDANISCCYFINNTAKNHGGAVFINETFLAEPITDQSTVTYSIFENNNAKTGLQYYGTAINVNDNYWGKNFNTLTELLNTNDLVIVVENKNLTWANVNLASEKEILVGNHSFTLKFVRNDGEDLNGSLPDYEVEISSNNVNVSSLVMTNNTASFNYSSSNPSVDVISILHNGKIIEASQITIYAKKNTQLSLKAQSYSILSNKVFSVILKDENDNAVSNKNVIIKINGEKYEGVTNSNGIVSVTVKLTKAGTYEANVNFAGDDYYLGCSGSANVKVVKQKTKLVVIKKTYKKSSKSKKLTATLKTTAGKAIAKKKVTFKVNGKKYTGKTNKKGKVTVKVKLKAKKTYKFTVKFAGDSTYKAVSKKSTVKIK